MAEVEKVPDRCDALAELTSRCDRPATVLFYIGNETIIPRCSLHAEDLRSALRSMLRPASWRVRRRGCEGPPRSTRGH